MEKAFVLCSGGIDSSTCAFIAWHQADDIELVSIDYGQRHRKEIESAVKIAHALRSFNNPIQAKHSIIRLPEVLAGSGVMLTNPDIAIPSISYDQIEGVSPTYVPYRNGTMLSIVTAHAQKWVVDQITEHGKTTEQMRDSTAIYFGAHAEDALNWAYPDCTPEWIGAMANAIYVGTYHTTRLITPLQWLRKCEIIDLGEQLGVPWADTWSCYAGLEKHCGVCPTCRARRRGFELAGVDDPTEYMTKEEETI